MSENGSGLRSARWFGGHDLSGFIHRASIHAEGISRSALAERPVIGICNSWSELVNCNLHFRSLAESVKRGVLQAGGLPLEFPTISLGENLMKPTTMLFRNLMAMDVEECIRAYPLDAVVLLAGCDKTVPAQLMGAASADVPAIMVTGGPAEPAWFNGRQLGAGTDLWHYVDELRAGRMSREQFDQLEAAAKPSYGHCNEMGTASTLACAVEALGMCLPGTASIPAVDAARQRAAEATGRRAAELARAGVRPSQILTREAFDNAITLLEAIGGSTNAVIHLLALAGRVGVPLSLERFDKISRRTPVIANVRPSGEYLVVHLHRAGGVPALLNELEPLLHGTALTVTGRTLAEGFAGAEVLDRTVIARLDEPLAEEGGIAVLHGSLAPDGAIIKQSAASPALFRHRGRAVVFEDVYDVAARIDDPELEVEPDSVLVLRNSGPKGCPSGVRSRFRASCSSVESPTSCASRTRA
jgi:dihydroxy-acid dehydratase